MPLTFGCWKVKYLWPILCLYFWGPEAMRGNIFKEKKVILLIFMQFCIRSHLNQLDPLTPQDIYYLWMHMPFLDECVTFGWICHFWMNLPFLDESAIFGWMCCAIYGWMCHFKMNVLLLDECSIYGRICNLWTNSIFG